MFDKIHLFLERLELGPSEITAGIFRCFDLFVRHLVEHNAEVPRIMLIRPVQIQPNIHSSCDSCVVHITESAAGVLQREKVKTIETRRNAIILFTGCD